MAKTRRVAVVTGGANGLGRASAFRLAEAGRAIAIWDQDREGSVHTMNEIVACGGEAIECDVDVASDSSIAAAAAMAEALRVRVPKLGDSVDARVSSGVMYRVLAISDLDYRNELSYQLASRLISEAVDMQGTRGTSE